MAWFFSYATRYCGSREHPWSIGTGVVYGTHPVEWQIAQLKLQIEERQEREAREGRGPGYYESRLIAFSEIPDALAIELSAALEDV